MGGALGKGPKKNSNTAAATNSVQGRKLSVIGTLQGAANGDPNQTGTVTDKGNNDWLRYASLSNAGYEPDGNKKTNQDSFISIIEHGDPNVSLFGVFDGHGASGHLVSGYVKREIPKHMDKDFLRAEAQKEPADAVEGVGALWTKTFERVDSALEAHRQIDTSLSGTTAVACAVMGQSGKRSVICANSGDSRAIIAYEEGEGPLKCFELSDDHKPDRESEMERITQCGGRVEPLIDENGEPIGPHRVWLANMMLPGLAMARSIGDNIAATVGVCATPEIRTYELTHRDKFMVIASDGVWEFLSNQDVIDIVARCDGDCELACREVCGRSYREWKAEEEVVDDITCVIVYFQKF